MENMHIDVRVWRVKLRLNPLNFKGIISIVENYLHFHFMLA